MNILAEMVTAVREINAINGVMSEAIWGGKWQVGNHHLIWTREGVRCDKIVTETGGVVRPLGEEFISNEAMLEKLKVYRDQQRTATKADGESEFSAEEKPDFYLDLARRSGAEVKQMTDGRWMVASHSESPKMAARCMKSLYTAAKMYCADVELIFPLDENNRQPEGQAMTSDELIEQVFTKNREAGKSAFEALEETVKELSSSYRPIYIRLHITRGPLWV